MEALHEGRHRRRRMLAPDDDAERSKGIDPRLVEPRPRAQVRERDVASEDEGDVAADAEVADGADVVSSLRLVAVPGAGRGAEIGVGARTVGGLLLVAVMVLVVLGARWWWVDQQATALPVAAGLDQEGGSVPAGDGAEGDVGGQAGGGESPAPGAAGEGGSPGTTGDGGSSTPPAAPSAAVGDASGPAAGPVLVHVVGEVAAPGVVELPAGARVVDAIDAAGGLTEAADAGSVNMARAVVDGEQVWVGAPGEDPPVGWVSGARTDTGSGSGSEAGGSAGTGDLAPVDLNRATQADLEELPGIGPVTAGRILAWREEHGGFTAVAELLEVSGIGERTLEQLEPLVVVGR